MTTPKTIIHTDGHNLFYRQIKMTNPQLGIDNMIGMALHMILYSMRKEFNRWGGTHTVFYVEGRSWRKDVYPEYKAQRKVEFAKQTEREQEDHGILVEAFDDFVTYLDKLTNVTVLQNPKAEADDMIAMFIEAHPDDKHIVVSSDSDFFQLLRHPNVMLYDPVKNIQIRQDGIYNDKDEKLSFTLTSAAKIKAGAPDPNFECYPAWYEYALFLKCIRGDSVDNIMSAYPGAFEKSTKNKIGIREAFEDKGKGFSWNNFMLQRWVDHNEIEHQVKDKYEFNRLLIDLNYIPDDVKFECLRLIAEETERKNVPAVEIGMGFMRFAGKWNLKRIGDNFKDFMPLLVAKYKE
jgi:5'-3' exonuclease